jgi:predicted enzyme related to lactoylglutathione lyase
LTPHPAVKPMAGNPVPWFEIYVADMARARAFYEAVFGVVLEKLPVEDMEYWSFPMEDGRYGAGGALAKMEGVAPGPGGTLVYFGCEDCAVEEARVEAAGGKVVSPKSSIGPSYGFISLLTDTEGNRIGLHSMA